jgi:hypothetical protein
MRDLRSLAVLALAVAACGGSPAATPAPAAPAPGDPVDEEHTLPELALEGHRFTPRARVLPPMPRVTKGKTTLAAARKKLARRGQLDAQIFAGLAWAEADRPAAITAGTDAALRAEARAALRDAAAAAGAKAEPMTLEMQGAAEVWLGDDAAAATAYRALLARAPEHPSRVAIAAQLAAIELRQGHGADAAALVAGWTPDQVTPLEAYVQAWAAFTTGDAPTARAAIVSARRRWPEAGTRAGLDGDLVLILVRTDTPPAEAAAAIAAIAGEDAGLRGRLLRELAAGYWAAGASAAASDAIDLVVAGPPPANPVELVTLRFQQAEHRFRLDDPEGAATRAIEAVAGLGPCAAACAGKLAADVAARLTQLAQFSHSVYLTTRDPRHAAAARRLYAAYLERPDRHDTAQFKGYLARLDDSERNPPATAASHGAKLLGDLALVRREELTACYEAVRLREPALEGAIRLSLEISAPGEVVGVASDPAGGAAGLGAVATCLAERVRAWRIPARATPGVTRVHLPLVLRPRAPATTPAP